MLQKTSGKRHLEVIQVRSPEELKRCDALIIPGGGKAHLTFRVVRVLAHLGPPFRINYYRFTCTSLGVDGTAQGIRQDKISVGDLRRCNTPFASRV
jgi:hypothetical protein